MDECSFSLWKDPFLEFGTKLKITVAFFIIAMLAFGTTFLLVIISFEKYYGDPKKRGILNQVIYV